MTRRDEMVATLGSLNASLFAHGLLAKDKNN